MRTGAGGGAGPVSRRGDRRGGPLVVVEISRLAGPERSSLPERGGDRAHRAGPARPDGGARPYRGGVRAGARSAERAPHARSGPDRLRPVERRHGGPDPAASASGGTAVRHGAAGGDRAGVAASRWGSGGVAGRGGDSGAGLATDLTSESCGARARLNLSQKLPLRRRGGTKAKT